MGRPGEVPEAQDGWGRFQGLSAATGLQTHPPTRTLEAPHSQCGQDSGTKVESARDHPPPPNEAYRLPQWIAGTLWGRLVGYAAVTVGDLGGLSESLPLLEKSLLLPKLEPQPAGSESR